MPVSSTQHRVSSGLYQNKQYDNIKRNVGQVNNIILNHPVITDEICRFGNNINQAINSYERRCVPTLQHKAISQSVIVPALLLLSQIKLTSPPSDKSSFLSDRELSLLSSENNMHPDDSNNGFNALLNPVVNALYKTGEIISRYDPLRFPGADATSLSTTTLEPVTIQNRYFLSEHLTKKTNDIIATTADAKQAAAIREMINELNNIATEAEKAHPPGRSGYKSIENLIYLIDKSKQTIDSFEINHGQETLCDTLRLQIQRYIKIANDMCGEPSKLKWKNYIEAQPLLTFTPDSRGDSFPSVESQIAGNLVKSVFGFNDDQESTSAYGSRFDAYSSLLTTLLAEKKMDRINFLPGGEDKEVENLRLVNLLLRDLEFNLENKGIQYISKSVDIFCNLYREAVRKDSKLSNDEVEKRLTRSIDDCDHLYLLRNTLKQPIEIDYNQQPDSPRFLKLLDLFVTIQCITEAIHREHLPAGRRDGSDHHYQPRIDIHNIRSQLQCKSIGNLELIYNENTHELKIVPTSGRSHYIINNNLRIKNILRENKRIDKIKFKPIASLRDVKNHSSISQEVKGLVTSEMYLKNKESYLFSLPDSLGLISDGRSKYLKLDEEFVKVKHIPYPPFINNRYVIEGNNNLYLRYREDEKFHPETPDERLNVDKTVDFIETKSNAEPLTLDERYALRSYYNTPADNTYEYGLKHPNKLIIRDIDKFIIKGMPKDYLTPDLRESMVKVIDDIEHALKKTIPYKGIVYKDTIIKKEKFNSMKEGQLLTSKLFTCTKTAPSIYPLLKEHIDSHNLTNNYIIVNYVFNIKKSGHSLEWYTEKFHNDDVFIGSNKHFKITDIISEKRGAGDDISYAYCVHFDEIDSTLLNNEEKPLAQYIDFEI